MRRIISARGNALILSLQEKPGKRRDVAGCHIPAVFTVRAGGPSLTRWHDFDFASFRGGPPFRLCLMKGWGLFFVPAFFSEYLFSSFVSLASLFPTRSSTFSVSPNYKIPANAFHLLNFPASHSNDKYKGTIP